MIDNVLHINRFQLGATGTSSSRSGSTSSQPTRTITEAQAADPFGIYIVPFQSGYGVIVSDGVNSWNVPLSNTNTVSDALHDFFTKYYKYSLLGQQNENGTYVKATSVRRSGMRGLFSTVTKAFKTVLDLDDEDFDAQYDAMNYALNADAADYQVALSNKKLLTLTNILANGNPTYKYFTVPYGYYYIGKDVDTAPYVSTENSKQGITNGETYDLQKRQNEVNDWVNQNTMPGNSNTKDEDKTMYYILLGLGTLFCYKLFVNKKKKK